LSTAVTDRFVFTENDAVTAMIIPASTTTNITSVKITLSGTETASDINYIQVFGDADNHCTSTAGPDAQIGANLTGLGIDDPDANFYENYYCGSPRNYSDYCNPEVDRMIDAQSQTLDPTRRRVMVAEIQKRLEIDGARPILGWDLDYVAMWPFVHNLVPHTSVYSYARFQEVWLDR